MTIMTITTLPSGLPGIEMAAQVPSGEQLDAYVAYALLRMTIINTKVSKSQNMPYLDRKNVSTTIFSSSMESYHSTSEISLVGKVYRATLVSSRVLWLTRFLEFIDFSSEDVDNYGRRTSGELRYKLPPPSPIDPN